MTLMEIEESKCSSPPNNYNTTHKVSSVGVKCRKVVMLVFPFFVGFAHQIRGRSQARPPSLGGGWPFVMIHGSVSSTASFGFKDCGFSVHIFLHT